MGTGNNKRTAAGKWDWHFQAGEQRNTDPKGERSSLKARYLLEVPLKAPNPLRLEWVNKAPISRILP
jgi:hypothetical protein